jgi:hypothetical protein
MDYKIDVSFQIDRLLPPRKRNPIMFSWLVALLKPLQENNDSLLTYISTIKRHTTITSQVIVLEKVLSELLGIAVGEPSVLIQNTEITNNFLVGSDESYSSSVFSETTFANSGIAATANSTQANFIIRIPSAIWNPLTQNQKQEFKAYVNSIKLYGTFYVIETY